MEVMMNASLQRLIRDASPETRYQIEVLLRQEADDEAWTEQLGPVYRQGDVARASGQKPGRPYRPTAACCAWQCAIGDIGYPVFQFDGRNQLSGIREIVRAFEPVVTSPWTTASWLTSPAPELDDSHAVGRLACR